MSALDDAYEAANVALIQCLQSVEYDSRRSLEERQAEANRIVIDAFLAHLADNPPEEMVEACLESAAYIPWEYQTAADALSDALRSIGPVNTDA